MFKVLLRLKENINSEKERKRKIQNTKTKKKGWRKKKRGKVADEYGYGLELNGEH